MKILFQHKKKYFWGPTEIWTRIAGFKVQSANHYTMGPCVTCDSASMVYKSGTQGQQKDFIYMKMRMILHIFAIVQTSDIVDDTLLHIKL